MKHFVRLLQHRAAKDSQIQAKTSRGHINVWLLIAPAVASAHIHMHTHIIYERVIRSDI